MTHEERQALREKHRKFSMEYYLEFCAICYYEDGERVDYPCDVIRVLNVLDRIDRWANSVEKWIDPRSGLGAQDIVGKINDLLNVTPQPLIEPEVIKGSENLKSSDLETEVECGHLEVVWVADNYPARLTASHCRFCPKCGVKL